MQEVIVKKCSRCPFFIDSSPCECEGSEIVDPECGAHRMIGSFAYCCENPPPDWCPLRKEPIAFKVLEPQSDDFPPKRTLAYFKQDSNTPYKEA